MTQVSQTKTVSMLKMYGLHLGVLYNKTNVLLLADIFETFRKTCMNVYKLDPAHYYTSPGLSWDALLKKTGVCLELLTNYDQHLFIQKGTSWWNIYGF